VKIALFGATGMIGQAVLRECLLDPEISQVLCIGRTKTEAHHPKVRDLVVPNLPDLSAVENELSGIDACLFCLGVSAAGMSEESYRRLTYDLTLGVAAALLEHSPTLNFLYVSGAGTDSTERGRTMWARVKGATENALLRLPFKGAYMFRPGVIQPLYGVVSKTRLYRLFYAAFGVFLPLSKALFPRSILTSEELARAMLEVAKRGAPAPILEVRDISAIKPLVASNA
jgi:uncharacterized protein YbjT (DUF2867 family)